MEKSRENEDYTPYTGKSRLSALVTSDEDMIIRSCSIEIHRLLGYLPDQLIGKKICEIMPSPYRDQHSLYIQSYKYKTSHQLIGHKVGRCVEGLHKNGSIVPIRLHVSEIRRGGTKYFVGIMDFDVDGLAFVTTDDDGIVLDCDYKRSNDTNYLFGRSKEMVLGLNIRTLLSLSDNVCLLSLRSRVNSMFWSGAQSEQLPLSVQVRKETYGFKFRLDLVLDKEVVITSTLEGDILSISQSILPVFGYTVDVILSHNVNKILKGIDLQNTSTKGSGEQNCKHVTAVCEDGMEFLACVRVSRPWTHAQTGKISVTVMIKRAERCLHGAGEHGIPIRWEGSNRRVLQASSPLSTSSHIPNLKGWKQGRLLGEGHFASVRLATKDGSGDVFAVKTVQKGNLDEYELNFCRREIEIMKRLNHPNIVRIHENLETDEVIVIIMDYVGGGELLEIVDLSKGLEEDVARTYFTQLVSAVLHMHQQGIVHRDLKLSNLLVDSNNIVRVIDFGFAERVTDNAMMDTFCGTFYYSAPEMVLGIPYLGRPVDVWSMGVILYAMVTRSFPFANAQDVVNIRYRMPPGISPELKDLLSCIFEIEQAKRPTVEEILLHSWMNS